MDRVQNIITQRSCSESHRNSLYPISFPCVETAPNLQIVYRFSHLLNKYSCQKSLPIFNSRKEFNSVPHTDD